MRLWAGVCVAALLLGGCRNREKQPVPRVDSHQTTTTVHEATSPYFFSGLGSEQPTRETIVRGEAAENSGTGGAGFDGLGTASEDAKQPVPPQPTVPGTIQQRFPGTQK